MKRALVLGGDGARGSHQVGMLRSLVIDQKLDFPIMRGISVGALNPSFLAQAPTQGDSLGELQKKVGELETLWLKEIQGNHSVYGERPGGLLGLAAGADSLYSLDPLKRPLQKHLSLAALRGSGRDFKVGTVSLVRGVYEEWEPTSPRFLDKVLASASIPVVFPFVRSSSPKDVLVDGGVRIITPLSSAFAAQADEVYVLLTSRLVRTGNELPDSGVQEQAYKQWDDNWLGTKVSGFDVLTRTVDVLSHEVYLDDIRGALDWNQVLQGINGVLQASAGSSRLAPQLAQVIDNLRRSTDKRLVPVHVLAPQEWYGQNHSATEFSPALIAAAIQQGRQIGADPTKWVWP